MLDQLGALAALALAGSLAVERLVTIAKTIVPRLTEATSAEPGESEMRADQGRRLSVLVVTLTASAITAFLVSTDGAIPVGTDTHVPWPLFALLISGGSAFWTSVVAYASAAKDVQQLERKERERTLPDVAGSLGAEGILPPTQPAVVREL